MLHPHRYTVLLMLVWNCSLTHQSQPTLCRTIFFLLPVILHHHRCTILFILVTHMFCYSLRDAVPTPRVHLYSCVHSFHLCLHRYTTSVTVLYPVLTTNYSVLPASWLFPSIPEGSRAITPIVIPRTTPRRLSWLPISATITLSVLRYQSSSLSQPTQIHNINSLLFALSTSLILVYFPNPHQYIHIVYPTLIHIVLSNYLNINSCLKYFSNTIYNNQCNYIILLLILYTLPYLQLLTLLYIHYTYIYIPQFFPIIHLIMLLFHHFYSQLLTQYYTSNK